MSDQMADVLVRIGVVEAPMIRHGPRDGQVAQILHRRHVLDRGERVGAERIVLEVDDGQVLVRYVAEHVDGIGLQLVERLLAQQAQRHQVGRVVLGVEVEQLVSHRQAELLGLDLQRVQIARAELGEGVVGTARALLELINAPRVRLQILLVLRVDGVELAIRRAGVEQRRDEELREATYHEPNDKLNNRSTKW
jgi:hypothetical protein